MTDLSHVPERARPGLQAMNSGKPIGMISQQEKKELVASWIARYIDGEEIQTLANELGLTRPRLYQLLTEIDADSWRSAQSAKALTKFEDTLAALNSASDGLTLARAREAHKSAQWELERLLRRLYGEDKSQINVSGEGITIQLVSFAEQQKHDNSTGSSQVIDVTPNPADS